MFFAAIVQVFTAFTEGMLAVLTVNCARFEALLPFFRTCCCHFFVIVAVMLMSCMALIVEGVRTIMQIIMAVTMLTIIGA